MRRAMRMSASISLAIGAHVSGTAPLDAQTSTADIAGLARDAATTPIARVVVRARDTATGFSYGTTTTADGRYWLGGLPPGTYDVSATRLGLRGVTYEGVVLSIGVVASLDFTLEATAVELAPLSVRIERPLISTTRSAISFVLDRDRIDGLPEESRSFIELARLVPGATAGAAETGGLPSFGTRGSAIGALNQQSLGVVVDGGDFTEAFFGELGASVPLLAVREFEVVQSQYSADVGRAASGVVSVVTRRGGSEPLVESFGLFRDRILNARGPFESERPDFDRRHWGVAAGGPLGSERTRYFAAFERRVQNDFATVNTGGVFPESEGTFRTPLTDNLMFARVDHRPGEAHEITLRYSGEIGRQLFGVGGTASLEHGRTNDLDMHSVLLMHRWTPSAGWLNEMRLHAIRIDRELGRNAPAGPTLEYPSLRTGPYRMRGSFRNVRVELRDDLSRIVSGVGAHRMRVGAHVGWQLNETESVFFENGRFLFDADDAALPRVAIATFADGAIRLDARNVQLALYARDDWSPVPGLTLNLGLRYDLETNGTNQGFVSGFADGLSFVPSESRPVDANNLAPRLGIAWDPFGEGRTVVRGGFGIFYDGLPAVPLQALERSAGVRTARIFEPGTTDVERLMVDPDTLPPTVWTQGRIETPSTRQLSLGVAQVLPGGVELGIDGVLIQARDLLLQRELNPLVPVDPVDPGRRAPRFPGFASVLQVASEGRATAKMLLVSIRKETERGWLSVGYTLADRKNTNDTWSRPIVPQTDPDRLDPGREWAPAALDERHRLVATGGMNWPSGASLVAKAVYASARPYSAIGPDVNGDSQPNDWLPGEGRNARRGPDFLQIDASARWDGLRVGPARIGLRANVYNLTGRANLQPSSVQTGIGEPTFGQALSAFPGRQVEVGVAVTWS